jgi:hypothetical protein
VENVHIGASCSANEVQIYKSLFQEFCDVFTWSYEEMPGIDPDIVVHEIKTYLDAKPIRKRLRPVHPRKAAAIKLKVENFLKADFVYLVALTDWVSNLVLVTKKQGTISMFVYIIGISTRLVPRTIIQPLSLTRSFTTVLGVNSSL